jgi:deoxyribodipyrimidine photolyase-related protein
MSVAILIFPHQLYKEHPALNMQGKVYLIEELLFFRQYHFHKQKIALHRASMKYYYSLLLKKNYSVEYIESHEPDADIRILIDRLTKEGINKVICTDPSDDWLMRRIKMSAKKHGIKTDILPNPNFMTTTEEAAKFFDVRKKYFQTDFYIHQRRTHRLLIDKDNSPMGGKWTFDAENREKLAKKTKIPSVETAEENEWSKDAINYTHQYYKDNYGSIDQWYYPITHDDAEKWLGKFLETRFENFGKYEDAMDIREHFLFHSVLTPMLNIGLLNPKEIISAAITYAEKKSTPLNSLEGFIRQIMGWREFIHIVYRREGRKQRTTNYWEFKRKIPRSFWEGNTGIEPVDIVIKKTLKTGYCHHIERLMILGNFMLLCEFDPNEVYRWFMEMFVDAYDWVMVPNVYGMTQFADGGIMTTKPYISGSNYLLKMGDWPKGEWTAIWDGLFWHFMDKQRHFFSQNPRLGMLLKTFDKMSPEKKQTHLSNAHKFLTQLDTNVSS